MTKELANTIDRRNGVEKNLLPAYSDERRQIPDVNYWEKLQQLDQNFGVPGFRIEVFDKEVSLAVDPEIDRAWQYLEEFSKGKAALQEVFHNDEKSLAYTLYGLALATYWSTLMDRRKSGDIYLTHLVGATEVYLHMGQDRMAKFPGYKISPITTVACLHHDSKEDADISEEVLASEFGKLCATRVIHVTDLSSRNLEELTGEERDAVALQKTLKGGAQDLHVLDIKISDRIHNFLTMDSMLPEKQERKARWTRPLLDICRLTGIDIHELSSLVLYYLDRKFADRLSLLEPLPLEVKSYIEQHVYPEIQKLLDAGKRGRRSIVSAYMRLPDAMEQYQWRKEGRDISSDRILRPVIMIPFSNNVVRKNAARDLSLKYGGKLLFQPGDQLLNFGVTKRITIADCKFGGCRFDIQLTHSRSLFEQLHAEELLSSELTEEKHRRLTSVQQQLGGFFSQDSDIYSSTEEIGMLEQLLIGRTIVVQVETSSGVQSVIMPPGATVLDVLMHTLTREELSRMQSWSKIVGQFGQSFDTLDSAGLELQVGPLSRIGVVLGDVDTYYRPSPNALSLHLTSGARDFARNRCELLRRTDLKYREQVDPALVEIGIRDIFSSLKKNYSSEFCESINPDKHRDLFLSVLYVAGGLRERFANIEDFAIAIALSYGEEYKLYTKSLKNAELDKKVHIVTGYEIKSRTEAKNHLSNLEKRTQRNLGQEICYYNRKYSGKNPVVDYAIYTP
jgi:HD domain